MNAPRILICAWMRPLVLVALALCGPVALAALPIRVVEPAQNAVLQGGSLATITWTPDAPLPAGVEEWEAFLSVDGGHYYATRITPHLDIELRTFEWRVPNVSSDSVKLLLRMGDERDEQIVELPLHLSIEATSDVWPSVLPVPTEGQAEAARPGDPAVVEWAAGDRQGHGVAYVHAPRGQQAQAVPPTRKVSRHTLLRTLASPSTWSLAHTFAPSRTRHVRASGRVVVRDLLLLLRRRNI
ncbi:MAG: hypothetical protein ABI779_06025 [Acidobacteriota bacterium]